MPYLVKSKLRTYPNVFTTSKEYMQFCKNFPEFVVAVMATEALMSQGKITSLSNTIDENNDLIFTRTWQTQEDAIAHRDGPFMTAWRNKWTELGWVLTPLEAYTT